LTFSKYKFIR